MAGRYHMETNVIIDDSEDRMYIPIRFFAQAMGYTVDTAGREKAGGRSRLRILFICIAKWGILAGLFAGFVRRAKRCCQCAGIAQSVVRLACGR